MNLISQREFENYLEHHQAQGAHWGVTHGPPYPLDRTDSGKISKKQEKAAARLERKEQKAAAKERVRADKKATKALKKAKDVDKLTDTEKEAMKKQVSRSKDIDLMTKYSELFTTEEINTMATRIQAERRLSDLKQTKFDKGMAYLEKATKSVKTLADSYDTAKRITKAVTEVTDKYKNKDKEAKKKTILKSKDYSQIYKNRDLFTDKEIKDFISRMTQEDYIKKKAEE